MATSPSYHTRSKISASTKSSSSSISAAQAKAHLALVDSEADLEEELERLKLRQEELSLITKLKKVRARKEVALITASRCGESVTSSRRGRHSLLPDPTPLDAFERTREYVVSQASLKEADVMANHPAPQEVVSGHSNPHDEGENFPGSQNYQPPPLSRPTRGYETFPKREVRNPYPEPAQDYLLYMDRREMLSSSLTKFSDQPKDYRAWKYSFLSVVSRLGPTPRQEMNMLVQWLGERSSEQAKNIRTAHFNRPERGLSEIWKRMDKSYGSAEVIQESIFKRMRAFPKIETNFSKLRDLSDLLIEFQGLKEDGDLPGLAALDSAHGIREIVEKLPPEVKNKWASYGAKYKRQHQVSFPPFYVFTEFIEREADDRNDPSFYPMADSQPLKKPEKANRREVSVHKTQVRPSDREHCPIHQTPHPLRKCWAFRKKPLSEREDILRKNGMCFRCCSTKDHKAKDCGATIKCSECGSDNHETAMHPDPTPQPSYSKPAPLYGGEKEQVTTNCSQICGVTREGHSCSKICLVNISNQQGDKILKAYAVIDEHSNKSLARSDFFEFFDDHGPTSAYSLRTCAGTMETSGRRAVGYKVGSMDGKTVHTLPTLIECNDIPDNRSEIPTPETIRNLPHLAVIAEEIPALDLDAPILLLLGRDLIEAHKVRKRINGPRGAPYAQKLDLGWVVVGDVCPGRPKNSKVNVFFTSALTRNLPSGFEPCPNLIHVKERYGPSKETSRKELQDLGHTVFQLSEEDESLAYSIEDRMFLHIMQEGLEKDPDNSWVAPLPFRPSRRRLPNNRNQAFNRLRSLSSQFKKKPQLKSDFLPFMERLFKNKHAVVAPPLAINAERWYLPMFGIYHPKKPGKIRVVFDSSAQYNGVSLNDTLLTGPDLINTLVGVLIRFRKDLVALMADIEQMFYCFRVKAEHRNFLRFLWYRDNDPNKDVIDYQMNVHVFGNRPSPAVATYCLRQSVRQEHFDTSQEVKEFVERNFYVDDGLMSVPTVKDAISLLQKTQTILAMSNLRLHKIASNKRAVLAAFPPEDHASESRDLDLDEDAALVQRSLGLNWDSNGDHFFFRVTNTDKPYTRRGVLSVINSLYDPLGFVAPVTVQGKCILRTLTMDNSDWDAPLPVQKHQLWAAWKDSLKDLHDLQIPRPYGTMSPSTATRKELCVFSDASTKAIAAVSYLRLTYANGACETAFVMGKTKLTPLPEASIPRLELCAAVLAVELADLVHHELDMEVDTTFYTDSRVVLGYINNQVRRFYVYVANRVQRIRRSSKPEQWHYVPTDQNPADCGTRSVPANQLQNAPWLWGPAFLSQTSTEPASGENHHLINPDQDVEIRPVVSTFLTVSSPSHLDANRFERFSSWNTARRAVARLIHIAQTFRREKRNSGTCNGWHYCKTLTVEVLTQARIILIKTAQHQDYAKEIICLKKMEGMPPNSTIKSLNPFIDQQGLLRVGGRTPNAGLSQEEMHPIIISGKHHVAILLVRHHHQRIHHQGRHLTEGAVRAAGLWIVGGKRCINKLNFKSQTIQENHLQSSNLNHYAGVLYMSSRLPNVSCILQPFSVRSRKRGSLVVDVVCSHGLDWVKVIARKAQALHLVWAGQGQFGDRDLMVQAQDYLRCAVQHPVNYIVPKVHFVFFNAITEPMAKTLTQLGIEVHGDVVAVEPDTQTKLESVQEISDCSSDSDDSQNLSEEELTGAVSSDNPGSDSGKARGDYLSQEGLSLSDKSMEALKEYSEGELTVAVHSVIPGSDSGTTKGDYLSQAGLSLSSAINKSMEALKEYSEGEFSERHSLNSWSRFSWLPFIVQKSFTLQNCTGLGKQVPEPLHSEGSSESNRDEGFVSHITRVNLDITTLITLVSAVSHGRCHFVFPEKILTMQAEEERQSPVLPRLVKFMEGKKLYCCQTAVSDFEAILATLGGESERERAKDLLSQVEIVPDQPSERSRSLPVTGKLKIRSKIIFGTGDHLQAITMTANTGYVRAAENHGVSFAVFPHASRALTEMKEKTATPLKTEPQKTKFLPKE